MGVSANASIRHRANDNDTYCPRPSNGKTSLSARCDQPGLSDGRLPCAVPLVPGGPSLPGDVTAVKVKGELKLGVRRLAWQVKATDEYAAWFTALIKEDLGSATLVAQAVAAPRGDGPSLGRPLVDRLKGSRIHHLKELRPGSRGRSEIRIIFAFDPTRSALFLLGGDKAGNWERWYRDNVPVAERRYLDYTTEGEQ